MLNIVLTDYLAAQLNQCELIKLNCEHFTNTVYMYLVLILLRVSSFDLGGGGYIRPGIVLNGTWAVKVKRGNQFTWIYA